MHRNVFHDKGPTIPSISANLNFCLIGGVNNDDIDFILMMMFLLELLLMMGGPLRIKSASR